MRKLLLTALLLPLVAFGQSVPFGYLVDTQGAPLKYGIYSTAQTGLHPSGVPALVGSNLYDTAGNVIAIGTGDMLLTAVQTVGGAKTFAPSKLCVAGSTSGSVCVTVPAIAGSGAIVWPTSGALMGNPMTTGGDVIYGGAGGVATRLVNGAASQTLQSNGTTLAPAWGFTPFVTKAADYPATAGDESIFVDSSGGVVTITLPTAVGVAGKKYTVKDWKGASGTNNITIATTSAQTIDGAATRIISVNYTSITVQSDGANWGII